MRWPQVTLIVLMALGWLLTLAKHGEPRTDKHDIGISTASLCITVWLLWCGGFWS